jgi:hypothetical protein
MLCCNIFGSGEERNFEATSEQGYLFKSFVTFIPTLKGYKKEQGQHDCILATSC